MLQESIIKPYAREFDNVWALPPEYSSYGQDIDFLYWVIFVIVGVAFIGVQGALLWFLFKYRRKEGGRAHYTHGSHALEVTWTAIPGLIFIVLAVWSNYHWDAIKNSMPENPDYEVRVEGQQFAWNVTHKGPDGEFDTADDIKEVGVLRLPANEKILIHLSARDVIHSLFIPHLRVKQDAVPGAPGNIWFEANETTKPGADGKYGTLDDEHLEITCAELCGFGHYKMWANLYLYPRTEFDKWVANP